MDKVFVIVPKRRDGKPPKAAKILGPNMPEHHLTGAGLIYHTREDAEEMRRRFNADSMYYEVRQALIEIGNPCAD